MLPPFLLLLNLSLNTLVMFLFAVEKLEKYIRRTKKLAAKATSVVARGETA